jgi:N4-(beta-N-acetylglucosaminyl)-L-asparaginase
MNTDPLSRRVFLAGTPLAIGATFAASHAIAQQGQPAPVAAPAAEGDAHRGPASVSSLNGLRSVERAMALMAEGYDPADCVVQGVRIVEDDPNDDSVGYGGLPNEDGVVELDACVMHGPTHKTGAVASLRGIRNPAMVALHVLRRTDHCLLVGEGALRFARAHGFQEENLLTEKARLEWMRWKENRSKDDDWLNDDEKDAPSGKTWDELPQPLESRGVKPPEKGSGSASVPRLRTPSPGRNYTVDVTGTIHCSIVTTKGDVASCTTTSGLNWKIPGRVGDSPIIGAGNYCHNDIGAAGCTGRGESAIVNLAAFTAVELMGRGMTPTQAALEVAKRIADNTREKRLRDANGRPVFNINIYALRKDGAYGAASLWPGARFSVATKAGVREVAAASLFTESQRP